MLDGGGTTVNNSTTTGPDLGIYGNTFITLNNFNKSTLTGDTDIISFGDLDINSSTINSNNTYIEGGVAGLNNVNIDSSTITTSDNLRIQSNNDLNILNSTTLQSNSPLERISLTSPNVTFDSTSSQVKQFAGNANNIDATTVTNIAGSDIRITPTLAPDLLPPNQSSIHLYGANSIYVNNGSYLHAGEPPPLPPLLPANLNTEIPLINNNSMIINREYKSENIDIYPNEIRLPKINENYSVKINNKIEN